MAVTGAAATLSSLGLQNRVSQIKNTVGVNPASPLSAKMQQHNLVISQQNAYQKGSQFSVTVSYAHQSGGTQGAFTGTFRIFDALGLALNAGVADTAAGVTYSSTFAGGGNNTATAYNIAKAYIVGARMGSVGTSFTYGNASYIQGVNLQIWNGNIQQYTAQTLTDYTTLAQDTYANNQAQLIMNTSLWLNGMIAITGALPDPGTGNNPTTLSILFNIPTHANF